MTTRADDVRPITIDLRAPLAVGKAFRFPLQSKEARRDLLVGALWLLVPGIGWILNLGHRIEIVRRMQRGLTVWPAWENYRALLRRGTLAFMGVAEYYAPGAVFGLLAWSLAAPWLWVPSAVLVIAATLAIPGYMTSYCLTDDAREIFLPLRAMRRVLGAGRSYWHAWGIAILGLATSFAGLVFAGIGFLVTSVWFWQVAGFAFATVFTARDSRGGTFSGGKSV